MESSEGAGRTGATGALAMTVAGICMVGAGNEVAVNGGIGGGGKGG